jgi:repressor LexA
MATPTQVDLCHSSNCHNGSAPVDRSMAYEAIREQMEEAGHRQSALANLLGVSPTAISKAFAGKRRFTAEEMDKIRSWLGPSIDIGGSVVGTIPVLSAVAAGSWREATAHSRSKMYKPDPAIPDHAIALDVEGDSMDLYVPDGGRIIFDPEDRSLWPRRFYVVQNGDGETTFKRFFADPARLEPCSTNPVHRPIVLGGDEPFTIVGRVIWQASRMPD